MFRRRALIAMHKLGLYEALDAGRDVVQSATAYRRKTFSQFGEDIFMAEYFGNRRGVYIDVGGNHPFRLSNTYLLYRRGWTGVVAEPIRQLCAKHRRFRPRDVQVNAAVGDKAGTLEFFEIVPRVLSTCDPAEAQKTLEKGGTTLLRRYSVPVVTVDDLYRKYVAPKPISVLSVDTEGHDLTVLKGIDWSTTQPELIVCEANDPMSGQEIMGFLAAKSYACIKSLGVNNIFELQR